jgi:hypothetical protein
MSDIETKVAAALAEYRKWGTGMDSRRPRETMAWVGREDAPGQWREVAAYRHTSEAEKALHVHAMRAAVEAAVAAE